MDHISWFSAKKEVDIVRNFIYLRSETGANKACKNAEALHKRRCQLTAAAAKLTDFATRSSKDDASQCLTLRYECDVRLMINATE